MDDKDWSIVKPAIVRLRASVTAVAFAVLGAAGLFLATALLLLRGGAQHQDGTPIIGPHLGLLANYFPGYTVTWTGAFIGAVYAGVTSAILGYLVAWVYNAVALRREN
jgi:hypothetical protein